MFVISFMVSGTKIIFGENVGCVSKIGDKCLKLNADKKVRKNKLFRSRLKSCVGFSTQIRSSVKKRAGIGAHIV